MCQPRWGWRRVWSGKTDSTNCCVVPTQSESVPPLSFCLPKYTPEQEWLWHTKHHSSDKYNIYMQASLIHSEKCRYRYQTFSSQFHQLHFFSFNNPPQLQQLPSVRTARPAVPQTTFSTLQCLHLCNDVTNHVIHGSLVFGRSVKTLDNVFP